MRVHGKLGCLQSTERLPGSSFDGTGTVTIRQTFATTMLGLERPDSGSSVVEVECPHCGETVTLRAVSRERLQTRGLAMMLVLALIGFGGGAAAYFYGLGETDLTNLVTAGLMGLGGLAVAGAALGFVIPSLFDWKGEALVIARDAAFDSSTGSEYAGARGHKLLEVWFKEGPG